MALVRLACVVALAVLTGCGSLARDRLAYRELVRCETPQQFQALAGRDPGLATAWMAAAASAEDPDEALQWLARGQAHHPAEFSMQLARLDLLARLDRHAEVVSEAGRGLAHGAPDAVHAEFRWRLIGALLARGETGLAEAEAGRLAADGAEAALVSAAWARVALAHETAGRDELADDGLDIALDFGGAGLSAVSQDTRDDPRRLQAAQRLFERGRSRHPRQPDLALATVVNRMLAADTEGARRALDELPAPLPARLRGDRAALSIRLALAGHDFESGLEQARLHLQREPADLAVLAVLVEAHLAGGRPTRDEMLELLDRARRQYREPTAPPARLIAVMRAQVLREPPAD